MSTKFKTQLPQTVSELQSVIRNSLEFVTKSPFNKQNKLNEITAASLGLPNFNALKPRLSDIEPTQAKVDDDGTVFVNNEIILNSVFTEHMVKFELIQRTHVIDELINYIKEDLITNDNICFTLEQFAKLNASNDEFILFDRNTKRVYCPTTDTVFFNQECNELLVASGYRNAEKKVSQQRVNNELLSELITKSPVLIKNKNIFISSSEISQGYLTICYYGDCGNDFYYEFNLKEDTFVRNGIGSFTLKSKEYDNLEIILFSPMNI
jgi:hypothetical protein